MNLVKEPTFRTVRNVELAFSLSLSLQLNAHANHTKGIALFASACSTLLALKDQCPKTIAVTHFSEALESKELTSYIGNGILHLHMKSLQEKDRLVPLFELRKVDDKDQFKSSKSDYGLWCASKAGVNKIVLDRARYIFDCIDKSQVISALSSGGADEETSKPSKYRQLLIHFLSVGSWITCSEDEVSKMFDRCCQAV